MRDKVVVEGLSVDRSLVTFINDEALPGTEVLQSDFWQGFAKLIRDFTPRNQALLDTRDALQAKIDAWHQQHSRPDFDPSQYKSFLSDIGYWVKEQGAFSISTSHVDAEIA